MSDGDETFLSQMRDSLKAFTEADPYFTGLEIINERLKDIDYVLDQKLSLLGGVAIVLVTASVGGVLTNVTGANFDEILFVARVLENVTLNDTGKEALDVAVYLAALWSQTRPDTFPSALRPAEPCITLGNDPKYLSYDVRFFTTGGTKIDIPRLAAPVLYATVLSAVILTVTTPGSVIFYTLDGSAPVPRNPAAFPFYEPFAASHGQTLRARAWLAGYNPSPEIRVTL